MKKRTAEKRNQADLAAVLKLPQGRRALWRLLQAAQVDGHGFVPGDPCATAFHCGQKSLGLFLQEQIIEVSPLLLAQMRAEYLSEVTSQQNEINKESEEMHNV
ncbi:MAG TPA: hypothetical protein IAB21_04820 [Candidatus Avelusimicrobium excrementipullorum]|nr:hypothetical protein [Candidatus Avelusimicrobium excrementipullorum]